MQKLPEPLCGHRLADIAAAAGVSGRTVRRAVAAGRIKVINIGRARQLVPPAEAARILAEGLRRPRGKPKS